MKFLTVIEKTEKEALNLLRVRATKNLEQVIIGDKIEPWEAHLLGLQVIAQALLALIKVI